MPTQPPPQRTCCARGQPSGQARTRSAAGRRQGGTRLGAGHEPGRRARGLWSARAQSAAGPRQHRPSSPTLVACLRSSIHPEVLSQPRRPAACGVCGGREGLARPQQVHHAGVHQDPARLAPKSASHSARLARSASRPTRGWARGAAQRGAAPARPPCRRGARPDATQHPPHSHTAAPASALGRPTTAEQGRHSARSQVARPTNLSLSVCYAHPAARPHQCGGRYSARKEDTYAICATASMPDSW